MISELTITNFAIIEKLHLRFAPGFNVLTGETGAGKSIIIDAVSTLLGGRVGAEEVRADADRAQVEGLFLLEPAMQAALKPLLQENDLEGDDDEALILAREMEAEIRCSSGPALERPGDLAGILTSLPAGGILFIDEIHRLHRSIEEYLYPAMEDFRIDIVLDRGPGARSVRLHLERFTLIGATTRAGLLSAPLRAR